MSKHIVTVPVTSIRLFVCFQKSPIKKPHVVVAQVPYVHLVISIVLPVEVMLISPLSFVFLPSITPSPSSAVKPRTHLSHCAIGCPVVLRWKRIQWSALSAWNPWRSMTLTSFPAPAATKSAVSAGTASAPMKTASVLLAGRYCCV